MVDDTAYGDTVGAEGRAEGTRPSLPGYELGALIGQGGMGEVVAARDPKIGREVAIKRMKTTSPTPADIERFLREAKIQARLAHPAIVPVHELGHDSEGRPYFTMKRLVGTTMAEVLQHGGQQQRLVRAFVDVCLAIERAHTRHVIHRDLKPANIMLGDYGEVYVLDWGVARIVGDAEESSNADMTATPAGLTQAGMVLGTPGYLAPETARGKAVGPPADIYALGSILFEILTGTPLHPRGMAAVASTVENPTVAPSSRAPDRAIPAELEAACVAALSRDPAARPTARALAERIQRYLDGDRDLERRRELAVNFLAQAKAATGHADRMQLAGRALALDPKSHEAVALVSRLMLDPPDETPPELARTIVVSEVGEALQSAKLAMASLASLFGFLPILLWMGVMNVALLVGACVLIAATIAFIEMQRRAANAGRSFNLYPSLVGTTVIAGVSSRICGPFVLVPSIVTVVVLAMIVQPQLQRRPVRALAISCLGFVAPLALEAAGVLSSTWQVQDGVITLHSTSFRLGGIATQVMLIGGSLVGIVIAGLFSRGLAISRRHAIQQLQLQTWRLKQLVPESVRR
jgi:serine/threonine-protein kinase